MSVDGRGDSALGRLVETLALARDGLGVDFARAGDALARAGDALARAGDGAARAEGAGDLAREGAGDLARGIALVEKPARVM